MNTETTTDTRVLCPACGAKGKRVSLATLRALLEHRYQRELPGGIESCCDAAGADVSGCRPLGDATGYRFCESPTCDTVYFAEQSDVTFTKAQLRVPVGVKETAGDRPLCYCFGHSVASIKEELRVKGRSDALEDVRAKMKDPGCRCETENPSGACCLGSIAKGIKTAQEELMSALNDLPEASADRKPARPRGAAMANIGALVVAIMASSCCWLPLVLLAFGISGAGIATALEAYRPLFIAVTFGFLSAAFYFTYRPKRAAGAEHNCCAAEPSGVSAACCDAPPLKARSFSIVSFNKLMLWAVTLFAVAFMFFPRSLEALLGMPAPCCARGNSGGNETSPCCTEATE